MKGAIPKLSRYSRPSLTILVKAVKSLPYSWRVTMVKKTMALMMPETRDEIADYFGYKPKVGIDGPNQK